MQELKIVPDQKTVISFKHDWDSCCFPQKSRQIATKRYSEDANCTTALTGTILTI